MSIKNRSFDGVQELTDVASILKEHQCLIKRQIQIQVGFHWIISKLFETKCTVAQIKLCAKFGNFLIFLKR